MELRWHAVLESHAELSGLCSFGRLPQKLLFCLRELEISLVWWEEDGDCCSTVKMRIVVRLLMRDAKYSVNIIVSGMEVGALDLIRQIIHLVPRDCLDSGECPLLTQCDTKGAHRIEGLHCSTTGLQV